jgi:hypothetical protein
MKHFVVMVCGFVMLIVLIAIGSGVLASSLVGIEGGVWGGPIMVVAYVVNHLLLSSPLLHLLIPLPLLSRSFLVCLACWFGIPLVLWLGYTSLNLVQAINVHLDDAPAKAMCMKVLNVEKRCSKITPIKGSSGSHMYCDSRITFKKEDGGTQSMILTGTWSDVPIVCVLAHPGFLGLSWVDRIRPYDANQDAPLKEE